MIQIFDRNASISHAFYQMLPQPFRKLRPLFQFGHLPAKNHLTEFLSEPFDILGVVRGSKAFRKFEKSFLLYFLCLEPLFDQFNEHAIRAQPAAFRHAADLGSDLRRQCDALTNTLIFKCHDTIMHQNGANEEMAPNCNASCTRERSVLRAEGC